MMLWNLFEISSMNQLAPRLRLHAKKTLDFDIYARDLMMTTNPRAYPRFFQFSIFVSNFAAISNWYIHTLFAV